MDSLFNDEHRYTEAALAIDNDVLSALQPIFEKYKEFSPREISVIAHNAVTEIELETVLGWRINEAGGEP